MDSEKQPEGFEGARDGRLGEPGGGYCMEHWVWCKNNEYCYAEIKQNKTKQNHCILTILELK